MTAEPVSRTQNGAEAILDLLRTNGTDCVFASPIATMAPLWEALAARRERGEPEAPRYFHCRHEMLAVSAASGYYKATGRAQAVFLPTGLGVLHGAMALRTALQERTPMTVLSPDTLTYAMASSSKASSIALCRPSPRPSPARIAVAFVLPPYLQRNCLMTPPASAVGQPATIRCAIYTRKSTEEGLDQAFTSLDAQREAALAYVHSQQRAGSIALPQCYADGGYSGGSPRPACHHQIRRRGHRPVLRTRPLRRPASAGRPAPFRSPTRTAGSRRGTQRALGSTVVD
jgi:hypothetical protein